MTPPVNPRKLKRKAYSYEDLKKALFAIRTNKKGIRETSRKFGIPRSTLNERLNRKHDDIILVRGPDPVLGGEGEKSVRDWLINITMCGFRVKKQELLDTVQKIVKDLGTKNPFKDDRPGETWYKNYLKRHPDLTFCIAEGIIKSRASATEESIKAWFSELETFLIETNNLDILDCPERIFNGDEYGFSMHSKTGQVLAPKGYRNLNQIKPENEKENLSVSVFFNATGQMCPPLVVFPYARPPRAVVESVPENWCLGISDSGWMSAHGFFEYITNDFNNWVEHNNIKKPILLLIDGQRSPMSLVLSAMCEKQGIILYALPPNTTHMQPADVSVFATLRNSWKIIVREFLTKEANVDFCVNKTKFCKLLQETLSNTNMPENIENGFRKCGLYPFNPNSIDYTKCAQNNLKNICKKSKKTTVTEHNICDEICNEDLIATENICKKSKKTTVREHTCDEICNEDLIATENICKKSKKTTVREHICDEICNEDLIATENICKKSKKTNVRENICDEICNEDLIATEKVLKYLRPVLEKKNVNLSLILKELRKLKTPEESPVPSDTESEEGMPMSDNSTVRIRIEMDSVMSETQHFT